MRKQSPVLQSCSNINIESVDQLKEDLKQKKESSVKNIFTPIQFESSKEASNRECPLGIHFSSSKNYQNQHLKSLFKIPVTKRYKKTPIKPQGQANKVLYDDDNELDVKFYSLLDDVNS